MSNSMVENQTEQVSAFLEGSNCSDDKLCELSFATFFIKKRHQQVIKITMKDY